MIDNPNAPSSPRPVYPMNDGTRLTFAAWLRAQRHRDDPVGDLARDTAKDRGHRVTKPDALYRRIERVSGYPPALDAARRAEREWQAMSTASDPRPPVSPGDWSALGLTDGRCPVGIVEHVEAEAVHLRLISAWTGEPMDECVIVRWADVNAYMVVPAEAGQLDSDGCTVMPDEPLWDFQTRWATRQQPTPPTGAERSSTTRHAWTEVDEPITEVARRHGVDPDRLI